MTKRYGVWDLKNKRFVFNINEDSKNRAMRELQRRIKKVPNNYVAKPIPQNWKNPTNSKYKGVNNGKYQIRKLQRS